MALIKCKECGKEISSEAQFCPNCGCPVKQSDNLHNILDNLTKNKNVNAKNKTSNNNIGCGTGCLLIIVACVITLIVSVVSQTNNYIEEAKQVAKESEENINSNIDLKNDVVTEIDIEKFSLITADSLVNSIPDTPLTSFHDWQMIDTKEAVQVMYLEYPNYNLDAISFNGCIGRVTYYPKSKITQNNINDLKICLGITSEKNFIADPNRQDLYTLNQPTDKIYSVNAILDINRQYVEEIKIVFDKKYL